MKWDQLKRFTVYIIEMLIAISLLYLVYWKIKILFNTN